MAISYSSETQSFYLQTPGSTYVIQVAPTKHLCHLYYGARVEATPLPIPVGAKDCLTKSQLKEMDGWYGLDRVRQEYATAGTSELRNAALRVMNASGHTACELFYKAHNISAGKPELPGLPATYVEADEEADTLIITLEDPVLQLEVELYYTVYKQLDVITRSVRLHNKSESVLTLERAMSLSVNFAHSDYDMLQLSGSWSRERDPIRRRLVHGEQRVSSQRGISSHQHNPFIALLEPTAHEHQGEVYGFSLVYSGNFAAEVEVDEYDFSRLQMGINGDGFSWKLQPGSTFVTPEVVCVYSAAGLEGMSQTYHDLYRKRLCRGRFRDARRPTVINTWEAFVFDVTSEKVLAMADTAKEIGVEMVVLDGGWYSKEDNPNSLGDWEADPKKFPEGIKSLAEKVVAKGIQFGLWFEPEMISMDTKLYAEHPDWCLHVPDRRRTLGRNQLVLDTSRADVQDYIIETVSRILGEAPITYVKWDHNRPFYEIGSAILPPEQQGEIPHRCVLGLYRILEALTQAHPDVLFESCAGGGGRYDPGMLYYMPQTWTSDNTDGGDRLEIQYGTSIVYPIITQCAHISDRAHENRRPLSWDVRGQVASMGRFGFELDITSLSEEEKEQARSQVQAYEKHRDLVQHGTFYRLLSPFEGNTAAWMVVSEDRKEALAYYFKKLLRVNRTNKPLRLRGLDPTATYQVMGSEIEAQGDVLMQVGLMPDTDTVDFASVCWHLVAR